MRFFNLPKVIALLLVAATHVAAYSLHPKIYIKRSGSADGAHYDKVDEKHDMKNRPNHSLICTGAGTVACGWMYPPRETSNEGVPIDTDLIMGMVDKAVLGGKTSGKALWASTVGVSWYYSDAALVIEIYPEGFNENVIPVSNGVSKAR